MGRVGDLADEGRALFGGHASDEESRPARKDAAGHVHDLRDGLPRPVDDLGEPAAQLAEQSNKKLEELKKRAEGNGNMRNARRAAIKNEGEWVERKPLTAWETYAQTLLLSNEAVYVN